MGHKQFVEIVEKYGTGGMEDSIQIGLARKARNAMAAEEHHDNDIDPSSEAATDASEYIDEPGFTFDEPKALKTAELQQMPTAPWKKK